MPTGPAAEAGGGTPQGIALLFSLLSADFTLHGLRKPPTGFSLKMNGNFASEVNTNYANNY